MTTLVAPGADARSANGGAAARRAVVRWAWRLFRREWRQQFLIFALIVVAVAGTIVGSAVATDDPQPANFGGVSRRVVGIVENPLSLLDEFALVAPGQVAHPTQVAALFDAPGVPLSSIGHHVETPTSIARSNVFNPETISLAALVLGMLLITLVSVGGFTVLAQRRLRSIGMLEATGATDRHVSLVVRANGTVVGLAGAIAGLGIGLVAWLAYRPSLEQSSHHVIGTFALSWPVVAAAMILAVVAAYIAASRPAKAITKVPIVTALSGRPAAPRQVHRSIVPGIVFLVAAFFLLGYAGSTGGGSGSSGMPELVLGIVLLIPGLILLAPFLLSLAARLARPAPIATRLALRDLARYRARSGSALAAIGVGILVAVIVMLAAAARYGNVFDYAGPNLMADELVLHDAYPTPGQTVRTVTPTGGVRTTNRHPVETATSAQLAASGETIARGLGARLIPLETPDAGLAGTNLGRQWDGPIYVATPQLLRAFGITPSEIDPNADILSSRPGLTAVSGLVLAYGSTTQKFLAAPRAPRGPRRPGVTWHPVVQELGALPTGTSAPNTVITEHAMHRFHLKASTSTWLVQGSQPFSASQIAGAQLTASTSQLAVESKNDQPTSADVTGWATTFGIVIALGVLGMSVGLVRSETASDLRTLTASGASSFTRRTLTAVTAGALGLLGAVLGTLGGYIGMIGWIRSNSLNGGIAALGNIPVRDLLLVVLGMPACAAVLGWILAGREPAAMGRQPIE